MSRPWIRFLGNTSSTFVALGFDFGQSVFFSRLICYCVVVSVVLVVPAAAVVVVVVAVVATDIVVFHVVHFVAVVAAVVVAVALVVDVFANVTVNVVVVVAVVAVLFVFVVVYLLPLLRNLSLFSLGKKSIELIVTNFAEILRIGEIFWGPIFFQIHAYLS